MSEKGKKTVCVDFDGVLNTYTGWQGEHELFMPREGAEKFLDELSRKFDVHIFTTRSRDSVQTWLQKYDLQKYISTVTSKKEPALAYVDDRAIPFLGSFNAILTQLVDTEFKTHWEMKPCEDFEEIDKMLDKEECPCVKILEGFLAKKLPHISESKQAYGEALGIQMSIALISGVIPEGGFLQEPNFNEEKTINEIAGLPTSDILPEENAITEPPRDYNFYSDLTLDQQLEQKEIAKDLNECDGMETGACFDCEKNQEHAEATNARNEDGTPFNGIEGEPLNAETKTKTAKKSKK